MRLLSCFILLCGIMLSASAHGAASSHCQQWLVKLMSRLGQVDGQSVGSDEWQSVEQGRLFCYGEKIRTHKHSRATLLLKNESVVTLDQNTVLAFIDSKKQKRAASWIMNLMNGRALFRSRESHKLDVRTPFINAVHEGTEFIVAVNDNKAEIIVLDGRVAASNAQGSQAVEKGFVARAESGTAPQLSRLTLSAEDTMQWALYYPPIVDVQQLAAQFPALAEQLTQAYGRGNFARALALLETQKDNTTPEMDILKAALLLASGDVVAAQQQLQTLPQQAATHALQAMIALAKNRLPHAEHLSQQAINQDDTLALSHLARSYVLQANKQIAAAADAVQQAVQLEPQNALAWARLAELQLSQGDTQAALQAAQKAHSLNPSLSKVQTVSGFAHLAQSELDAAQHAFSQAADGDPLAMLGQALTEIRRGDLHSGKQALETAVNLDPNNAIPRSYLGKALHALHENTYADTELTLAKEMDANDPTPWLYSALIKQAENRPAEALRDLNQSLALNDNRGIYRSQLLLDEDAAARTANRARIYQDLGFDRVALKQAWTSLGMDAGNHAAHRFLSDSYIGQPRYRIARASELLQAQLLQPVNLTPVQPQLNTENIDILNSNGPSRLSTGEYDQLFTRNKVNINLNGAYGSNNTWTDNAIVSGLYDNLSLSIGQFHYQTDGFRSNDHYQQDVYNAFVQYAFTPHINWQFELKSEDIRNGDVPFRLNGLHNTTTEQTIEHDTLRTGLHVQIAPGHDVLFSAMYSTRKEKGIFRDNESSQTGVSPVINVEADFLATTDVLLEATQLELQYLFNASLVDVVAGFGYMGQEGNGGLLTRVDTTTTITPPGLIFPSTSTSFNASNNVDYFNAYLYSTWDVIDNLSLQLGLSFDSFDKDVFDTHLLNPKVGLVWQALQALTLRGAVFRSLKRPLATNQSIEPTQVAGFNQFYDGSNGTESWQYAFGLDAHPLSDIYVGGEVVWLDNTVPFGSDASTRQRNEMLHKAYVYWTPMDWLALTSEYHFNFFDREFTGSGDNDILPQSVTTHEIPLSIRLFHPSGVFSQMTATYVNQEVVLERTGGALQQDVEQFWTVDANIGYRLPYKKGVVSLEVRNLLDEDFAYQSAFDASGPQLTPYVPERELFVKLSLFF